MLILQEVIKIYRLLKVIIILYEFKFLKDKISSNSNAQSVNTTKRSLYSARQRNVKERPKTSKVTATSPRILMHTNHISRNVLSPHKHPTFMRTARVGGATISEYDILASSKTKVVMNKRIKKKKKTDDIFSLTQGKYIKRPETFNYFSSINTLRDKMNSTPLTIAKR